VDEIIRLNSPDPAPQRPAHQSVPQPYSSAPDDHPDWRMTGWVLVAGYYSPSTGEVEVRCDGFGTPWEARGLLEEAISGELYVGPHRCDCDDEDPDAG
jgi:hypothetical protein